jgi:hypothetical protein
MDMVQAAVQRSGLEQASTAKSPEGQASDLDLLVARVVGELRQAEQKHGPLHSAHEAYAVLLEEVEEFKAEVFKRANDRDPYAMRDELVQVAAMAMRAILNLRLSDLEPKRVVPTLPKRPHFIALNFPGPIVAVLALAGFTYLEEVQDLTRDELRQIPGVTRVFATEIERMVAVMRNHRPGLRT